MPRLQEEAIVPYPSVSSQRAVTTQRQTKTEILSISAMTQVPTEGSATKKSIQLHFIELL
jgi:hypothetical protein